MSIVLERTKKVDGFPNYQVTNTGRFFNASTKREMTLSPTQNGDLTVAFRRDGRQYRFSAKGLVARAFVDGESYLFNTPILLDGDKYNLNVENIVWRPRWFAWRYTHQFKYMPSYYFYGPIVDRGTMIQYRNYIDVAVAHGLLCEDILESIYNNKLVFPTHQKFAYVN